MEATIIITQSIALLFILITRIACGWSSIVEVFVEPFDSSLVAFGHFKLFWLQAILKHFTTRLVLERHLKIGTTTTKSGIVKLFEVVSPHF